MNRKIVAAISVLVLAGVLILIKVPAIFAEGSTAKTYSLNEAIDTAVSSNISLNLLSQKISVNNDRRSKLSGVDLEVADNEIIDYQNQRDEQEKQLRLDVTNDYHKLRILQQLANLKAKQIERLQKEYENQKKKVELGNETELSLTSFDISISTAKNEQLSIKNDIDETMMNLNHKMGTDTNQQLILRDETLPYENLSIGDISKVADDLAENSNSIKKILRDTSTARKQRDNASTDDERDGYVDKILELQYKLEDEKFSIKFKVRSDYNNLLNLKDGITIKKLEYDKNVKLTELAKLKYDMGLIIYTEYSKAEEDMGNALYAYKQAELDYYIAVKKYKNFIQPALSL